MGGDGSVSIAVDMDISQAEKELAKVKKSISELEKELAKSQEKKLPLEEQSKSLAASLDAAKAKLEEMKAATSGAFTKDDIADQRETVKGLQAQYNAVERQVEKNNSEIERTKEKLNDATTQAQELSASMRKNNPAIENMNAGMEKFTNRVKGLARRVFVFSVITAALRGMRTWLSSTVKGNEEAATAIARLKGALLTLAQPLVGVIIPAFVALVNVLTKVVSAIATVVSALFGTTAAESANAAKNLNDEANAIGGVGSAAKKASKQLASFDEINKIGAEESTGGGGGGASGAKFDFPIDEQNSAKLLNIIRDIGLALLGWRLGDGFLGGLKTAVGLLIAIRGATMLAKAVMDAWDNGVSFKNLGKAILGLGVLVAGLGIAFGVTGAAIGLIIGGITLLIVAIKDIMKNGLNLKNGIMAVTGVLSVAVGVGLLAHAGIMAIIAGAATLAVGLYLLVSAVQDVITNGWNLENTLTAIAGIILTGLGISLLTGSLLPLLVAGIMSVLLAITVLSGNGDELIQHLKQVFQGFVEFIGGVFAGDWGRAWEGIKNVFKGTWNSIVTILESAINLCIKGINWLIQKLNEKLRFSLPDWIPEVGGKSFGINIPSISNVKLPRLAQGAVIPPNREFMAVLGDQKSGTNIETPLSTMVQAFKQALAESSGGSRTIVFEFDKREFGRVVFDAYRLESQRVGVEMGG